MDITKIYTSIRVWIIYEITVRSENAPKSRGDAHTIPTYGKNSPLNNFYRESAKNAFEINADWYLSSIRSIHCSIRGNAIPKITVKIPIISPYAFEKKSSICLFFRSLNP